MGDQRVMDVTLVATGNYTNSGTITNSGDTLTPATVGLDVIDFIAFTLDMSGGTNANNIGIPTWNSANGKIQLFASNSASTIAEMTNNTTITGLSFRCLIYGVA